MRLGTNRLVLSPSALNAFLACEHLTTLQLAVARGEIPKPFRHNPHAELIRRKGDEWEAAYLAQLRAAGREIVEPADATATEGALRAGADVVFQAVLADDGWLGKADFVERQADGRYEVVDTKLARHARPAHVLQLCFYTEQVARITGRPPAQTHVVAGSGERESFRPEDFAAYYRRVRERFLAVVTNRPGNTYPYPVEHCSLCAFLPRCQAQWEHDDHLTLVAGVSRLQHDRLLAGGIRTMTALGAADTSAKISKIRPDTFERLRHQAELQLHRRHTGEHRVDLLPQLPDRGFALLPEPNPGDIWLDLEGHPWFEPARGLEYLFGWIELDEAGAPRYRCLWAHDRAGEKRALEELIVYLTERRTRHPGMHVYHYAPYERTALSRLAGEHATREAELDELLRGEVLVDLYRVTRQALRASVPSYSIKEIEALYGFERTADVSGGTESVEAFETWLMTGGAQLLEGVRLYNEEDCVSTLELHRWLLAQRPPLPWRLPPEQREQSEEAREAGEERDRVRDALLAGAEEGEPRWLLAQLLDYHRREARPQWWAYFHNLGLDGEELVDNGETIGGLEPVGEPVGDKQSLIYSFTFPPQEHKIGTEGVDPATEQLYRVSVNDEQGTLTARRSADKRDEPLPQALIPARPIPTRAQREAVLRFAQDQEAYPAVVDMIERRPPRALLGGTLEEAALSLDGSYLFVQGPPGSGKTWRGARVAIALMRAGKRVGVTALSHKAIHKFLEDLEEAALAEGFRFRGLKRVGSGEGSRYEGRGLVESSGDFEEMLKEDVQLLAGTSFFFARAELDRHLDVLFIDEGGQFSLADAVAVSTSARNLVLLGDPNQLPQVSQAAHPPGANASVLEHLLGDDETVRPEMGVFLEETWRLRPEICGFISEAFYEGRLHPAEPARRRSLELGNGLRFLPVEHGGHRSAAPEEAEAIRDEIQRLVGSPYTEADGTTRPLRYADVKVVAPFNAHVRCLREKLPEAVQVGTVDKFQGQEAVVIFYSMASSSGQDVPRGLGFLFSRNRLNVAISRARCLAYLVCSPRLLEMNARTVEQMRLANAVCRLVELSEMG
jgi:predicted RecB family nuclease